MDIVRGQVRKPLIPIDTETLTGGDIVSFETVGKLEQDL